MLRILLIREKAGMALLCTLGIKDISQAKAGLAVQEAMRVDLLATK